MPRTGEHQPLSPRKSAEPPSELFYECQVCYEFKPKNHFHPIRGCIHPPHCAVCVGIAATEEINGKGITTIRCKALRCDSPLDTDDIQRVTSKANFDRYNHLQSIRFLETLPQFIYCSHAGCGTGMLHEGGDDVNIVTCPNCKWRTCFTHKEQMHLGLSCKDYDAWKDTARQTGNRNDEDELSRTMIEQTTKPCPSCKTRVEKNKDYAGDCDKLTCRRILPSTGEECGVEFCWFCQGRFFGGDPKNPERVRVYTCNDPDHAIKYKNPRVPCGVGLHCHHNPGCSKISHD
jgi:E3 ubiquitin-protein ligase RNF14